MNHNYGSSKSCSCTSCRKKAKVLLHKVIIEGSQSEAREKSNTLNKQAIKNWTDNETLLGSDPSGTTQSLYLPHVAPHSEDTEAWGICLNAVKLCESCKANSTIRLYDYKRPNLRRRSMFCKTRTKPKNEILTSSGITVKQNLESNNRPRAFQATSTRSSVSGSQDCFGPFAKSHEPNKNTKQHLKNKVYPWHICFPFSDSDFTQTFQQGDSSNQKRCHTSNDESNKIYIKPKKNYKRGIKSMLTINSNYQKNNEELNESNKNTLDYSPLDQSINSYLNVNNRSSQSLVSDLFIESSATSHVDTIQSRSVINVGYVCRSRCLCKNNTSKKQNTNNSKYCWQKEERISTNEYEPRTHSVLQMFAEMTGVKTDTSSFPSLTLQNTAPKKRKVKRKKHRKVLSYNRNSEQLDKLYTSQTSSESLMIFKKPINQYPVKLFKQNQDTELQKKESTLNITEQNKMQTIPQTDNIYEMENLKRNFTPIISSHCKDTKIYTKEIKIDKPNYNNMKNIHQKVKTIFKKAISYCIKCVQVFDRDKSKTKIYKNEARNKIKNVVLEFPKTNELELSNQKINILNTTSSKEFTECGNPNITVSKNEQQHFSTATKKNTTGNTMLMHQDKSDTLSFFGLRLAMDRTDKVTATNTEMGTAKNLGFSSTTEMIKSSSLHKGTFNKETFINSLICLEIKKNTVEINDQTSSTKLLGTEKRCHKSNRYSKSAKHISRHTICLNDYRFLKRSNPCKKDIRTVCASEVISEDSVNKREYFPHSKFISLSLISDTKQTSCDITNHSNNSETSCNYKLPTDEDISLQNSNVFLTYRSNENLWLDSKHPPLFSKQQTFRAMRVDTNDSPRRCLCKKNAKTRELGYRKQQAVKLNSAYDFNLEFNKGKKLEHCLKHLESGDDSVFSQATEKGKGNKRKQKRCTNETGTDTKEMKKRSRILRNLDPHECEPYVCIPRLCNPRKCLKRIHQRDQCFDTDLTRSRMVGPPCPISVCPGLHLARRPKPFKTKRSGDYAVTLRRTALHTGRRQAVKIGSTFSFDIEFYKNITHCTEDIQSTAAYIKEIRKKTKSEKQRNVGVSISAPRTVYGNIAVEHGTDTEECIGGQSVGLQNFGVLSQSKGTCTGCLCTFNLIQEKGTDTRCAKKKLTLAELKAYECRREICSNIPRECDPYQCYRKMYGKRYQEAGSRTKFPRQKSIATGVCCCGPGGIIIDSEEKPCKKNVALPARKPHVSRAIKFGSEFKCDVVFRKDKLQSVQEKQETFTTRAPLSKCKQVSTYNKPMKCSKASPVRSSPKPCRNKYAYYPPRCHSRRTQLTDDESEDRRTMTKLKRCFCTLALFKKQSDPFECPKDKLLVMRVDNTANCFARYSRNRNQKLNCIGLRVSDKYRRNHKMIYNVYQTKNTRPCFKYHESSWLTAKDYDYTENSETHSDTQSDLDKTYIDYSYIYSPRYDRWSLVMGMIPCLKKSFVAMTVKAKDNNFKNKQKISTLKFKCLKKNRPKISKIKIDSAEKTTDDTKKTKKKKGKKKRKRKNMDKLIVERERFKKNNPFRQAVAVRSSFSFNVEFYKDRIPVELLKPLDGTKTDSKGQKPACICFKIKPKIQQKDTKTQSEKVKKEVVTTLKTKQVTTGKKPDKIVMQPKAINTAKKMDDTTLKHSKVQTDNRSPGCTCKSDCKCIHCAAAKLVQAPPQGSDLKSKHEESTLVPKLANIVAAPGFLASTLAALKSYKFTSIKQSVQYGTKFSFGCEFYKDKRELEDPFASKRALEMTKEDKEKIQKTGKAHEKADQKVAGPKTKAQKAEEKEEEKKKKEEEKNKKEEEEKKKKEDEEKKKEQAKKPAKIQPPKPVKIQPPKKPVKALDDYDETISDKDMEQLEKIRLLKVPKFTSFCKDVRQCREDAIAKNDTGCYCHLRKEKKKFLMFYVKTDINSPMQIIQEVIDKSKKSSIKPRLENKYQLQKKYHNYDNNNNTSGSQYHKYDNNNNTSGSQYHNYDNNNYTSGSQYHNYDNNNNTSGSQYHIYDNNNNTSGSQYHNYDNNNNTSGSQYYNYDNNNNTSGSQSHNYDNKNNTSGSQYHNYDNKNNTSGSQYHNYDNNNNMSGSQIQNKFSFDHFNVMNVLLENVTELSDPGDLYPTNHTEVAQIQTTLSETNADGIETLFQYKPKNIHHFKNTKCIINTYEKHFVDKSRGRDNKKNRPIPPLAVWVPYKK